MNDLQRYAAKLSTSVLQSRLQGLNEEADALESDGHPVDDIENEIRILEQELESR